MFIDPAEFEASAKVTQVITSQHIIMIMSMIALIIIFSLFSFLLSRKNLHQSEDLIFNESNLYYVTLLLFAIFAIANIVLFRNFLLDPTNIYRAIFLGEYLGRDLVDTSNLSSFVNLVLPLTILSISGILNTNNKIYYFIIFIVFLSCLLRAFLNYERLAIIEFFIAFFTTYIFFRGLPKYLSSSGAIVLPILLVVFFGIFEYFRSWNFYQYYYDNFWQFSYDRVVLYYLTALNNGAIFYEYSDLSVPYFSIISLWQFPLINLESVFSINPDFKNLLYIYGNPEFNNVAGIFALLIDYGFLISIILVSIYGLISGYIYESYNKNNLSGLLFFPLILLSTLEIIRIAYLGIPRSFISIIILIVIYLSKNYLIKKF